MLSIYTTNNIPGYKCVDDVESRFRVLLNSGETFDLRVYTEVIKRIDGVTVKHGTAVRTKFGDTYLGEISTGCKAVLLAIYYCLRNEKIVVNATECGNNALKILFILGSKYDLVIFTLAPISLLDFEVRCMLNNTMCEGALELFNKTSGRRLGHG